MGKPTVKYLARDQAKIQRGECESRKSDSRTETHHPTLPTCPALSFWGNEVWETMAWKVKNQQQLMFIVYNPGPVLCQALHTHVQSMLPRAFHSLHKCLLRAHHAHQVQGDTARDTTPALMALREEQMDV